MVEKEDTHFAELTPIRARHSKVVRNAREKFAGKVGSRPRTLRTDGAKDYKGSVEEWLSEKCSPPGEPPADHNITHRYSPWEDGLAENRIGQAKDAVVCALFDSGGPTEVWPMALRWWQDTEALASGAYEEEFGEDRASRAMKNMGPFGCVVTVVKEEPEIGETLEGRSFKAFLYGYESEGVLVGFYTDGRLRTLRTQNFRIFRDKRYWAFDEDREVKFAKPREEGRESAQNTTDDDLTTWVECSECKKWREVRSDDVEAVQEIPKVFCSDMGIECSDPQDPSAWRDVVTAAPDRRSRRAYYTTCREIMNPYEGLSAYATVSVPRGETTSEAVAYVGKDGTNHTNRELFKAAIEKELDKYTRFGVFDIQEPVEQSVVEKEMPDAEFAWLNMVYTWKHAELDFETGTDEARTAAARLVVVGSHQHDRDGVYTTGVYKDESLWTAPPSLVAVKAFVLAATLMGLTISVEDFKAAYLTAPLRGPPVYLILPAEVRELAGRYHEGWKTMKKPCARARRAAYGQKRAGHDYEAFVDAEMMKAGWRSLREFESEPCLYLRDYAKKQEDQKEEERTEEISRGCAKGGSHEASPLRN